MKTMRILIAPNAFKNSLSAEDAAKAIGAGLAQSKLQLAMVAMAPGNC
jgi:glycerate kinase